MIVVVSWTGREARMLREALRMPVLRFAEHLGVSPRTVSDWERAREEITPTPGMRAVLDTALRLASDEVKVRFAILAGDRAVVLSDSSQGEENGEGTDRREAIWRAITTGVVAVLPSQGPWAPGIGGDAPAHVGLADVARIRDAARDLEKVEAKVGGAAARYVVLAELRAAQSLKHASMTPAVRQEWTAAMAYLADLAGWATFDAGLHGQARELFEVALGAARESADQGLLANVADNFARFELSAGQTANAFDLACLAQSVAWTLPASVRARLEVLAAQAYARVPDERACVDHIHLAEEHYARAELSGDPDWMQYFTLAKLEGDIAVALYDLALRSAERDERPFRRLQAAVDGYPANRARSKAMNAARLATLLYRDGQVRDAASVAMGAVDLAATVRSARLADALRATAGAAQPYLRDEATATVLGRIASHLRTARTAV